MSVVLSNFEYGVPTFFPCKIPAKKPSFSSVSGITGEAFKKVWEQALERLLRLFEEQGNTVTTIRYTQRLLGLDLLSEDRYRQLMRLFALNNDRASALHVYHTCVSTLQREMGIDPAPATAQRRVCLVY